MTTDKSILNVIPEAVHAVQVFYCGPGQIEVNTVRQCIRKLENGVAVEIIFSKESLAEVGRQPFLFNKLCLFVSKGGTLYVTKEKVEEDNFTIIDFQDVYKTVKGFTKKIEDEIDIYISFWDELICKSSPYLVEEGDIKVKFEVSEKSVLKGDFVSLHWEVEGAGRIIIEGLGVVKSCGSKKIRLEKDAVFKIGAYNHKQSGIKALGVKVYEDLHIGYELGYTHQKTGFYHRLMNNRDFPHVYGVAAGNRIRLSWNVKEANQVKVIPFNVEEKIGKMDFEPEGHTEIEIQASSGEKTIIRKIKILYFPIPVFKEKFINFHHFQEVNRKYSVWNHSAELYEKLSLQRKYWKEKLTNAEVDRRNMHHLLLNKLNKKILNDSDKKRAFVKIKLYIYKIIGRNYKDKSGVLGVLQSIKSYYGLKQ